MYHNLRITKHINTISDVCVCVCLYAYDFGVINYYYQAVNIIFRYLTIVKYDRFRNRSSTPVCPIGMKSVNNY